jgi:surface antigen
MRTKAMLCWTGFTVLLVSAPTSALSGGYPYDPVCPYGQSPSTGKPTKEIPGGKLGEADWWSDKLNAWIDRWSFAQCNCTSYVAWRLNNALESKIGKSAVVFTNAYNGEGQWGDAGDWVGRSDRYWGVIRDPFEGAVAAWKKGGSGALAFGHVAYVESVKRDANGAVVSIDITEYNYPSESNDKQYYTLGRRTLYPGKAEWPDRFIPLREDMLYFAYYTEECRLMSGGPWGNICANDKEHISKNAQMVIESLRGQGGASKPEGLPPVTGSNSSGKLPDLVPNRVWTADHAKKDKNVFRLNERAYCRMQIKNIGQKDADGKFSSTCYLSDGFKIDQNPKSLGKEDTKGLDKGDTHTENEDFVTPEYPGVYNVVACVDSHKDIKESNEKNNCSAPYVFRVTSTPDLTIGDLYLQPSQGIFAPGDAFSITVTSYNLGESFERDIRVGYFLTNITGEQVTFLGSDNIKREHLKGGDRKTESLPKVTAPTVPGTYFIKAVVDYDQRIEDANRTNNELTIRLDVQ